MEEVTLHDHIVVYDSFISSVLSEVHLKIDESVTRRKPLAQEITGGIGRFFLCTNTLRKDRRRVLSITIALTIFTYYMIYWAYSDLLVLMPIFLFLIILPLFLANVYFAYALYGNIPPIQVEETHYAVLGELSREHQNLPRLDQYEAAIKSLMYDAIEKYKQSTIRSLFEASVTTTRTHTVKSVAEFVRDDERREERVESDESTDE